MAGGLLALLLFIPLIAEILKRGPAGQSCATWMLWGALDVIVAVSIIQQHGNFLLPLGFAIGDVALVMLLLAKGRFEWNKFETMILVLVVGCLLAWKFGGDKTATIAATLGIFVAGIPGWKALRKNPQRNVGNIWAGYVAANLLSFFGGTAMTVEERFAPGVFAVCSLALVVASRKQTKT